MKLNKRTIFQNSCWFWQSPNQENGFLKGWLVINLLIVLGTISINSLIPALVVVLLQRSTKLSIIAVTMIGIGTSLGMIYWLQGISYQWMTWKNAQFRMKYVADDGAGFLQLPLAEAMNDHVQKIREISSKRGYADDGSGIDTFWPGIVKTIGSLITLMVIIIVTGWLKIWLPLVIIGSIGLNVIILHVENKQRFLWRKKLDEAYFNQQNIFDDSFSMSAGKDIRLFNLNQKFIELIDKINQFIKSVQQRINQIQILAVLLVSLNDLIRNMIVYGTLVLLAWQHLITIAEFVFFFSIIGNLSQITNSLIQELTDLLAANMNLNYGRVFLDYISEHHHFKNSEKPMAVKKDFCTQIEMKDVSYKYPGQKKWVIKHLNLTIHENENIALVGLNGAGKTTLVMLLTGLLKPTAGTVLIDGISLETFSKTQKYRLFAPVFQENIVLAETVAENIAVSKKYEQRKIRRVLQKVGLEAQINQLPNGLQTQLTTYIHDNGILLSGGQIQRLMLARALYRDAKVIVLDEPTASLDALSESNLYQQYRRLLKNKISIFISHRLASTRFADRVIFLQNGRISAMGSHAELIKNCPIYKKMYDIQSNYYRRR